MSIKNIGAAMIIVARTRPKYTGHRAQYVLFNIIFGGNEFLTQVDPEIAKMIGEESSRQQTN